MSSALRRTRAAALCAVGVLVLAACASSRRSSAPDKKTDAMKALYTRTSGSVCIVTDPSVIP